MKRSSTRCTALAVALALVAAAGCQSPYRSDRGALVGGLAGAGLGAIVGNAVGNPGAGAAIGAGVGALSGAAVGGSLDEIEARNRAEIEARLGRPVAAGAVSNDDVIAMTRGGVAEELIINHVRAHGMVAPLSAGDLIVLQQQGVSTRVIQAMQQPAAAPPVMVSGPPPVMVAGPPPYYYGPPPYYPPPYCGRPGVSWGVTVRR